MAYLQKNRTRKFFNCYLVTIIFLIITITMRTSAWDLQNCPNFCLCFWLYGLKWADCTDHRLYSVQTGVDETVQALDISNNSISSLANYELRDAGLTKLKLLNLSSNAINEIGLMAFVDLSQLRVLDLSKNHLYYILSDTFVKNKKLEVLKLATNNLNHRVPKLRSFSLGSLDLSNCGISHLPLDTFEGLPRLRALHLTNNVMIQLELDVLKTLPNLEVLKIEGNPWSCNRNMYELQKRLRDRRIIFKIVCSDNKSSDLKNLPKKFEKMIASYIPPYNDIDDNKGNLLESIKNWKKFLKIDDTSNRCQSHVTSTEIIEEDSFSSSLTTISPYWFFAVGFLLGSSIATIFTYFWLTRRNSRPLVNIDRRGTIETVSLEIANQRANLLEHVWQNNDDANRSTSNCPGTPPPPYRDVMLHANRYPRRVRDTMIFNNDETNDE